METRIYLTKLSLNAQKDIKNIFIEKYLIPELASIRLQYQQIELFFTRKIEGGPVVNIYYRNINKEDAQNINKKLETMFKLFIERHGDDIQEQNIYTRESKNIAKMNGLKLYSDYENFNKVFVELDNIERFGEYKSIDEKETFNEWLFSSGKLIEETIEVLYKYPLIEQRKFIISIFLYCSKQLNGMDLDGYLSFKSHYIGFVSTNKKKMMPYHEKLMAQFKKEQEDGQYKWHSFNDICYAIEMDKPRYDLLDKWYTAIDDFVCEVAKLKKLKSNIFESIQMMRFRTVSNFHKKAFALQNLTFYKSEEFQAYRRVVNLIYLLLPTLGFNTIERLYCALGLILIVEKEIYHAKIEV